ncbi:protein TonB [Filimonas zeae]|uniref:Biopolymer transporter TonB n=1 Tax=Filimonas zeae TaxID=1737353 RepID=A0A917J4C6_9BACT|nr:energy transducer TonB [Filimonas zeae]MDR6341346.1 protein TonB [Filimonas zeae]GGH76247.1 biopolymer transporter TonB [Filimonas zeae]
MDTHSILTADMLDILFEGKNKAYGAYALRRSYRKRLVIALIFMAITVILISAVSLLANTGKKVAAPMVVMDVQLEQVQPQKEPAPEPPPPPPPQHAAPPKVEMIQFTPPRIIIDEEVQPEEQIQDITKLEDAHIGTYNQEGVKDAGIIAPPTEERGTGAVAAPKAAVEDYDVEFKGVQIQAKFPGGDAAWRRYLERNLEKTLPVENGAPLGIYTVVVSFLVDKDGSISEVKAENNPGYGTGEEAVRVIRKGPKWQPAIQNGRNVIFRQRQSISFQVAEEQ